MWLIAADVEQIKYPQKIGEGIRERVLHTQNDRKNLMAFCWQLVNAPSFCHRKLLQCQIHDSKTQTTWDVAFANATRQFSDTYRPDSTEAFQERWDWHYPLEENFNRRFRKEV